MCAISGIFDKRGLLVKAEDISDMLDTISYRGPDNRGFFLEDSIGFGHLRLNIIDLTDGGNQPMISNDGNLVIVFNGEIFNYIEIRDELKERGCVFRSYSDTEVILNAYQEWGELCVGKFNGMWAFAIWDRKKKKLFCSRDRFGVKPFFYSHSHDRFIFASEMKAILKMSLEKPKMNKAFFYQYLDRQSPVNSSDTVFSEIKTLLPGHNLILENGKMRLERYWHINIDHFRNTYDYSNPKETFRNLLIDAVRLRLRSDVPIGVCLSGGIDSSVIVAIITGILGQKINTFSSVYTEKNYNEEEYINAVTESFLNPFHKIHPEPRDFLIVLDAVIAHLDEPVRMPSIFSQWHVFKCAKENNITVTLDGQGADELLGGYREYYPYYLAALLKDIFFKGEFNKLVKFFRVRKDIIKYLGRSYDKDVFRLLLPKFLLSLKRKWRPAKRWQDSVLREDFIMRFGGNAFSRKGTEVVFQDMFNQRLFETFAVTNLPMVLDFEDRISMAFSMEARTPFLDYRIVEFCFGLPYEYKMDGYRNKAILRDAFKDILPEKIFNRKDKKGFPTPNEYWFRNEIKKELQEILYSESLVRHGVFDPHKVRDPFERHLAGENQERLLFRVVSTELWMRKYFD